jgi:hypothetical protein
MPERVRFFNGQVLSVADLEAEQNYHLEMRRLHNRVLHGVGVVQGLTVTKDMARTEGVIVSPGFALDGQGREIIVDKAADLDIGRCTRSTCFVTLQYKETPSDPSPTRGGVSEFSRITEGFVVATASQDPAQGDGSVLGLARLLWHDDHWRIDQDYHSKKAR